MDKPVERKFISETMRIGGKKISTEATLAVHYPYTNEIVGTVPAGSAEHARKAFEIAASFKPKLTRYQRQQILFRAAELIAARSTLTGEHLAAYVGA